MIYTILVVVFIAVFGFIAVRIVMNAQAARSKSDEVYVCQVCNEKNCSCEQKKNT